MQGLELSRRFYFEAVRPILDRHFPRLEHAAALIGSGSEVLGYDDDVSTDHHWGPRVLLFLRDLDSWNHIDRALAQELPGVFAGYSTNFGPPDEIGVRLLTPVESGPIAHRVEAFTLRDFLREHLGCDPRERFDVGNWLATPTQHLLQITAGEVFSDPTGELTSVRELLAWYPHDVWLVAMTGHWRRIGELEHLLGRTGSTGDELGSRLIAASLVREVMRLGLLQERRYAPYAKWLGRAYADLQRPERSSLEAALRADEWPAREAALADAYERVALRHNELGITTPVDTSARGFHGRPFRIIGGDRFVAALREAVTEPALRSVEQETFPIDAVSDNSAVWSQLRSLWSGEESASRPYK
jgi:hypothetical protein